MNIESFREYCLQKKRTSEGFPFDETTLVIKVLGKMFALTNLHGEFTANLKCDPEKAIALREQYTAVLPGYHMSKTHWNTINPSLGNLTDALFKEWIDDSYNLVIAKMTKKDKALLNL